MTLTRVACCAQPCVWHTCKSDLSRLLNFSSIYHLASDPTSTLPAWVSMSVPLYAQSWTRRFILSYRKHHDAGRLLGTQRRRKICLACQKSYFSGPFPDVPTVFSVAYTWSAMLPYLAITIDVRIIITHDRTFALL